MDLTFQRKAKVARIELDVQRKWFYVYDENGEVLLDASLPSALLKAVMGALQKIEAVVKVNSDE